MPLLLKISSRYPELNDAERKVADMVLKDPDSARALSITRLADLCGVSQSTINRFSRTLGYEGYTDFKLDLASEVRGLQRTVDSAGAGEETKSELKQITEKVFEANIRALADVEKNIDFDALSAAREALTEARNIALFGAGSSLPVVMDLFYRLMRVGLKSQFSLDSHIQAITAGLMNQGDIAVAISYSGESRETLEAIELARNAGARTLCVTSFRNSTLAKSCEIVLVAATLKEFGSHEAIAARLAQLSLCDALCAAVTASRASQVDDIGTKIDSSVFGKHVRHGS